MGRKFKLSVHRKNEEREKKTHSLPLLETDCDDAYGTKGAICLYHCMLCVSYYRIFMLSP